MPRHSTKTDVARVRYRQHKWNAEKGGVSFDISLEDWVGWWEEQLGPDWLRKRGPRRGQYVMGRLNNSGSFKLGNIRCVRSTQNVGEAERTEERRAKIGAASRALWRNQKYRALMSAATSARNRRVAAANRQRAHRARGMSA